MFRVLVTGRNFATVTPDFNYFIERGYEHIEEKLRSLGATIWREPVEAKEEN